MNEATRRKPRQARAMDKVDRILGAAREVLIAEGPEGFNTNRIAQEAGVAIGSIYEYFPNKLAIALRLIDEQSEIETREILERYAEVAGRSEREVITAIIAKVYEQYLENGPLYRILWTLAPDARRIGHRPGERAVLRAIASHFKHLKAPELAAFVCFHMVESLAERFALSGDSWDKDTAVAEIALAVSRYLGVAR